MPDYQYDGWPWDISQNRTRDTPILISTAWDEIIAKRYWDNEFLIGRPKHGQLWPRSLG